MVQYSGLNCAQVFQVGVEHVTLQDETGEFAHADDPDKSGGL